MIRNLTFAGVNLRTTYGLRISGSGTYDSPVRVYDAVKIPGRDGDLLLPEKRFENVVITYPAFIETNFEENYPALKAFLLSQVGYKKLTDSYHAGKYRMAYFPGALLPEMTRNLKAGRFDLKFVCKPQHFLTEGDSVTTMTTSGTFTNPTLYECRPLIKVFKSEEATTSELTIGDITAEIDWSGGMNGFRIDCDMMSCYYVVNSVSTSVNHRVSFNSLNFPSFKPGDNGITIGSGISRIEITPHTYTI